jgi:hypothetical protein
MNFNSSYNYICLQQFIHTDLWQQNPLIKTTVNELKLNYLGMSP